MIVADDMARRTLHAAEHAGDQFTSFYRKIESFSYCRRVPNWNRFTIGKHFDSTRKASTDREVIIQPCLRSPVAHRNAHPVG
jgi:hypothetical protein